MKNKNVILISGFSRGGTNILWNLICSHPGIQTTGVELNEILGPGATDITYIEKIILEIFAIPGFFAPNWLHQYVHSRVILKAKEHSESGWGKWKSPDKVYSDSDFNQIAVCTKSVNSWSRGWFFSLLKRNLSLKYTSILRGTYKSMPTIYLIRDPEAQCNGWMRRGCTPSGAGKWYRKIIQLMLLDYQKRPDEVIFVHFEDVLSNPLGIYKMVSQFINLPKYELNEFHLKSKKILRNNGAHNTQRGNEGDMIWVSRDDIGNFLDAGIDKRQRNMLNESDRSSLYNELGDICEQVHNVIQRP